MRDVLPIVLGVVVIVLGLLAMQVVRVFDRDPERGMRLFGAIGMLFHSFFKSKRNAGKRHHHRRRLDPPTEPEHEHARRPTPHPTGFMTIRAFATPPRRRADDDDPTPPETPETL